MCYIIIVTGANAPTKKQKLVIILSKIGEFFLKHNYKVENGRLCLSVLCDSTIFFLLEMVEFLEEIGCTDIQTESYEENDDLYGWRYKASGKMPKNMIIKETKLKEE